MCRIQPNKGRAEVGQRLGSRKPLILGWFPTRALPSLPALPICVWRVTLGGGGEAGAGADLLLRDKGEVGQVGQERKNRDKPCTINALQVPYLPARGRAEVGQR